MRVRMHMGHKDKIMICAKTTPRTVSQENTQTAGTTTDKSINLNSMRIKQIIGSLDSRVAAAMAMDYLSPLDRSPP